MLFLQLHHFMCASDYVNPILKGLCILMSVFTYQTFACGLMGHEV